MPLTNASTESASHAGSVDEKNTTKIQDAPPVNSPETMSLDPDAPYKHAPPKYGDPWTTVLTPELEADTLRCSAWKEEVQNLLIFAGLFSAVVTAFVIQSYKLLQRDPNAAMVGLLFQIASSLNNTSPLPPSVNLDSILTPFSQTASSIRINVFWFISLILSLTTVLVGTIALQWLREHQSYIGYSGKEKLAILHMRKQAAEAWYLPQVFTALPLLLQGALVLFLGGLIDFSLPLGPSITIPISIVIGLVLLFLSATTILPSLQGLAFFWRLYPLDQETIPTPCPYKSPQSLAFRTLYGIALRGLFRIFPPPSLGYESSSTSDSFGWIIKNRPILMPDHLAPSVYDLWYTQTWLTFDREWLSLRDACHQRILDDDPDLYHHRYQWKRSFPLSDVTQCLVKAVSQTSGTKHTDAFLAALVHCFQELSESVWTIPGNLQLGSDMQRKDRRNHYFEQLHCKPSCSMSKFLLHGGDYEFGRIGKHDYKLYEYMEPKLKHRLLCDDQTVIFLRMLLESHSSPTLAQYQLELWSRILQFSSHVLPLTSTYAVADGPSVPIPTIIEYPLLYSMIPDYLSDKRISTISNVLSTLLQLAASHRISQDPSMNSLCTHSHMVDVLNSLAYLTTTLTKQQVPPDLDNEFVKIFEFVTNHLNEKLSDSGGASSSQEVPLDVFFYLSSVFVWGLLHWLPDQDVLENQEHSIARKALRSSLDALHKSWKCGTPNERIETRFQGYFGGYERFSDKWWHRLFKHIIGPEKDDPALKVVIPSENKVDVGTSPLLQVSTTSYRAINPSPNQHHHDNDTGEEPAVAEPFSQPQRSIRDSAYTSPSILNQPATTSPNARHHDGDIGDTTAAAYKPENSMHESISTSPSIPNHPATTVEGKKSVHDLAPQDAKNSTSRSDGHDLQSGELHLTSDVELEAIAVQVEPINVLSVSNSASEQDEDQSRRGHVIIHMEPPGDTGELE